jgi:DNA-binding NarL/FixJ family response regulator
MSSDVKIRLLVVDDHPVVREGLRSILDRRAGMTVVATASDAREALSQFRLHKPDVTLMDLRMPGMDGVETIEEMRKLDPAARIVVVTTYADDEDVYLAMKAGASAYLLKDVSRETLAECIRAVFEHKTFIPPEIASKLASRVGHADLTERESTVLRLMAAGKSNKLIGEELGITEGTVKTHVNHLLQKLKTKTRTEAVRRAMERGLVRLP